MTTGVWVLGVAMTHFGRYPDGDDVDLAFQAASGALADADVEMSQVEVLAAGSTMNRTGLGQEVQKQLGQYGIPVYNVVHGKYKTSDWVLHFQWPGQGDAINLVDVYAHYTSTGAFYLPDAKYLD